MVINDQENGFLDNMPRQNDPIWISAGYSLEFFVFRCFDYDLSLS